MAKTDASQPPKILEEFTEISRIRYRASNQLKSRSAKIRYNPEKSTVEVEFLFSKSDENRLQDLEIMVSIPIRQVEAVHREDYIEKSRLSYVLSVCMQEASETKYFQPLFQHVCQFPIAADRDKWFAGLSQVLDAVQATNKRQSQAIERLGLNARIKQVRLEEPRAGILVAIRCNLANKHEELLEVSQQQLDDRTLKQDVIDWMKVHRVEPNELTSLYRLAKCLVQRATVEVKTANVVQKINDFHFDNFITAHGGVGPEVLERVNTELAQLDHEMTQHIGQHGVASYMIIGALRRNAQKMQIINKMACKIHDRQHPSRRA